MRHMAKVYKPAFKKEQKENSKSPFFVEQPDTSLPKVPLALHTKELFKKSEEALGHLKEKSGWTGRV